MGTWHIVNIYYMLSMVLVFVVPLSVLGILGSSLFNEPDKKDVHSN